MQDPRTARETQDRRYLFDKINGITPVRGSAAFNFLGANAPPTAIYTTEIAAGGVFQNSLSVLAPGFNGYLYVYCRFWPARGFAVITDIGARNIAAGCFAEAVELESSR